MKILIAIDPGASGGLAVLHHNGSISTHGMPETCEDVYELIKSIDDEDTQHTSVDSPPNIWCYIEQVSGYIGSAQPASRAFEFGRGYGEIIGILTAVGIPHEMVPPQRWIKTLGLGTKGNVPIPATSTSDERKMLARANGRNKTAWKNKLKSYAQRCFPGVTVTLAVSDALCILRYAQLRENAPLSNDQRANVTIEDCDGDAL